MKFSVCNIYMLYAVQVVVYRSFFFNIRFEGPMNMLMPQYLNLNMPYYAIISNKRPLFKNNVYFFLFSILSLSDLAKVSLSYNITNIPKKTNITIGKLLVIVAIYIIEFSKLFYYKNMWQQALFYVFVASNWKVS